MGMAAPPAPVRAAMYLRQSKDADGNEVAVSRQRQENSALLRARGITTWGEYCDNDRSATNGKPRLDYQRLLADISAGRWDLVVTWDLDRLHRQPIELEHFMKLADDKRLALATVSGDVNLATDNGRLFARIKGAVAMAEVERKSARQKAASKQMAVEDGRPWWPSRPFGYDADPDPNTGAWWTVRRDSRKRIIAVNEIRKHPTEAKLLAEAYRKFNAGSTISSLAKFWNDEGITSPRGNRWTGAAVRALLVSARNAGLREYDGQVVGKGTWPAIVEPEVWEQARRKVKDPTRRTSPQASGRKYLLSGIARCGVCAEGWQDKRGVSHEPADVALGTSINSRGVRLYVCTHCHRIARNGEKVDQVIIAAVVRRLSRDDAADLLRPPIDPVDAAALGEERRALRDKLGELGKEFATAPPEFTRAALAEINGRLAEIGQALEDPGKAQIFEDVIGAKDVRKAFTGLDLGRRRTIVAALMTPRVNPVGKRTGPVFDADAIEPGWKEDL